MRKYIIIGIVVFVVLVCIVLGISLRRCDGCGEFVLFSSHQIEKDNQIIYVCEDSEDSYNNDQQKHTLTEVTDSVINMMKNNNSGEIAPYVHQYASEFLSYCYENYNDDESYYVDCGLVLFEFLDTAKNNGFEFDSSFTFEMGDTKFKSRITDINDASDLAILENEYANFLVSKNSNKYIEDIALVDIEVGKAEWGYSNEIYFVAIKIDGGWHLIALGC